MVNYKNGKIYKILDLTNDNFYIGSTTKEYLSQRLEKHRTSYTYYLEGKANYSSSFEIISNENYKIYLLENAPCVSKDELRMREQYWINRLDCIKLVNKIKAFRTDEDKKNDDRKYYENNKEYLLEYQKEYNKNNKDKVAERKKQYYLKTFEKDKDRKAEYKKEYSKNNKEKITQSSKIYYEKNKERILERQQTNIQCERCNAIVQKGNFKRHQTSSSCINALPHGLICKLAD